MLSGIEDLCQKMPISGGRFDYVHSTLYGTGRLQTWHNILYSSAGATNIFHLSSNNGSSGSYCSEKKRLFSQLVNLHGICMLYDCT